MTGFNKRSGLGPTKANDKTTLGRTCPGCTNRIAINQSTELVNVGGAMERFHTACLRIVLDKLGMARADYTGRIEAMPVNDLVEVQRFLTLERVAPARLFAELGHESVIDMTEPVIDDEYCTVTIGRWGGYLVQIVPMIFNDRLVMTPECFPLIYDFGWCFPKGPAAYLAAAAWNPETEAHPPGHIKAVVDRSPGARCACQES